MERVDRGAGSPPLRTAPRNATYADALVHEAAHQLVNHRLLAAQTSVPPWLSEGVASYFGYTYLDGKGSFHCFRAQQA